MRLGDCDIAIRQSGFHDVAPGFRAARLLAPRFVAPRFITTGFAPRRIAATLRVVARTAIASRFVPAGAIAPRVRPAVTAAGSFAACTAPTPALVAASRLGRLGRRGCGHALAHRRGSRALLGVLAVRK